MVRWPLWCGLLPLVPLLVLAVSALAPARSLVLAVSPRDPAVSAPFRLLDGPLGSPLITLRADLPANSAMGLAVDLLDERGEVVLELTKEGWRETGSWVEGGESGTWDESDTGLSLAMRPPASGTYRLRLSLEDLLDSAGQPLEVPVVVRATVRNHTVDAPLLWFTAAVSLGMVWILRSSVYGNWRQRRVLRVEEGRVALRLSAGGEGLLRVRLRARYERPRSDSPPTAVLPSARLELSVSGPRGERLLEQSHSLAPAHHSNDGDHWLTLERTFHLRLPEPESIRVRVDLTERLDDGGEPWEIEWLELVLEDGLVTPIPVTAPPLRVSAGRH
jgi:hypothetical protein